MSTCIIEDLATGPTNYGLHSERAHCRELLLRQTAAHYLLLS